MLALPFISGLNKITPHDKKLCTTWFGNLSAQRGKKQMQPRLEEMSEMGQMRKITCGSYEKDQKWTI
jgi:hypothetical protein